MMQTLLERIRAIERGRSASAAEVPHRSASGKGKTRGKESNSRSPKPDRPSGHAVPSARPHDEASDRGDSPVHARVRVVSTGWASVDAAIGGGLACGGLHEWLGMESASGETAASGVGAWRPPLGVFIHLAWRALAAHEAGLWTVWIGRKCFPYPAAMPRGADGDRSLLERSLFVAPRTLGDRLWAMDVALRSSAVGTVVGDGSALDMAATRRLQLAAKQHGTLVLIARPAWERGLLSAAQTRWLVRYAPPEIRADGESSSGVKGSRVRTEGPNPRWTVELLRCKGMHVQGAEGCWPLEWDRAACTLNLSARVVIGTGEASASQPRRGRVAWGAFPYRLFPPAGEPRSTTRCG